MLLKYYSVIRISELGKWYENKKRLKKNEMERKIVVKDNLIEALLESVGAEGTIMMPTQSWENLDPTAGVHCEEPEEWWELIRDNWPAYDKDFTRN